MKIPETKSSKGGFERLGECLYRRGGTIYARVRLNGRPTWRSTETNDPKAARQWLKKWRNDGWLMANGIEPKGVVLQRQRVTVGELIDAYLEAGCPTRKMQSKSPCTVKNEIYCLSPVRSYFGDTAAATLSLADCDKYRDWRTSGGYVSKFTVRGKPQVMETRGGKRSVDLELTVLCNALNLALRRGVLTSNPLAGRSRYSSASEIRHCREVAPTPEGLKQIEYWLRARNEQGVADVVCFLAFSGLRIGEALPLDWEAVDWSDEILHVKREKRGITPWVPILSEMKVLLRDMQKRATSHLLFPSPFEPDRLRDASAIRQRLRVACERLGLGHVTPHGLRSYFVTQARQSGLTDADIAMLIGDKTGPAIIAHTYGDVRPDHLKAQAQRIRLTVSHKAGAANEAGKGGEGCSIKSSIASPGVAGGSAVSPKGNETVELAEAKGVR